MGGSVLSVSSRALLDACARLGLDTGQILQAARLDPVTLQDPDTRIPIERVEALWQKAYELSHDPNLALHAIEVLPVARSKNLNIDPASAGDSLAYAGLSYRLRALVLSGEVEKGNQVSYAFRIGTRF